MAILGFLILLAFNIGFSAILAGMFDGQPHSPGITAAIWVVSFIVLTVVGIVVVWIVRVLWKGIEKATVGALDHIGPTYNDNRSINIVNIEGRRYIIKDDIAIPLDD